MPPVVGLIDDEDDMPLRSLGESHSRMEVHDGVEVAEASRGVRGVTAAGVVIQRDEPSERHAALVVLTEQIPCLLEADAHFLQPVGGKVHRIVRDAVVIVDELRPDVADTSPVRSS